MSPEVVMLLVFAGVAVGFSSALFGVGGGILMVPLIVLALGKSQHLAEGTSLLAIVPTAIAGVLAQKASGFVSFRSAGLLATGGVVGAFAGALAALSLPHDVLRVLFAAFLGFTGLRLLRSGIGLRTRRRTDARTLPPPEPSAAE